MTTHERPGLKDIMLMSLTLLLEYERDGESGVSVTSGKVGDNGDSGSAKRSTELFLPGEVMSRVTRGGVARRSSTTMAGISVRARVVSVSCENITVIIYLDPPFSDAALRHASQGTADDMRSLTTGTARGQSQQDL